MRLVIVQDYLRMGGTERQTLFLAEFAAREGHDVRLLVFRPGGHLASTVENPTFKVEILQGWDTRLPLYAPGLIEAVRRAKPEAVLCMGRTANCYAGFIQRALPSAVVLGTLRTGKTLFPLHAWSLRQVKGVLVNSNWWKRRMLERGFGPERIHVVHNSNLLHHSEKERANLRARLRKEAGISEETCVYLNVATFRSGKRHHELVRLFAAARNLAPERDTRLWLVGDGPERRRCERLVAELGIGTRVRFWGYKTHPVAFYAAGDIAVSASREDSLPNFLIEAQAAGLPIIAYDFRGVGECCDPDESGCIVPMGNAETFAAEMDSLGQRGERWQAMHARAPLVARERFSAPHQAEETLAFIQHLIDAGSALPLPFSA
jgi:glycosyltransferase involved in cell wall biosynthesis